MHDGTMNNSATPKLKLDLIVYDLDGTLVDAFEDIQCGVNYAMRLNGLPELALETVKSAVGDGTLVLIERLLGRERANLVDPVHAAYREYYATHAAHTVSLYPRVRETLAQLQARGMRQAVLTNKPDEVCCQTLETLAIRGFFDAVFGERPDRPRKPDAAALGQVLTHFDVDPSRAAMVGDYNADFGVARGAGTHMIGVTYGLLSRERVEAFQPDAIIDSLDELLALVEKRDSNDGR